MPSDFALTRLSRQVRGRLRPRSLPIPHARASRALAVLCFCAACAAASAWFAYRRGQDVSWDQLNYHYYSAYAFVRHRIDLDAAPAQMLHSYYNPLAFLPFYWLFHGFGARAANLGLGAIQGMNFALVLPIATGVCRGVPPWPRRVCVAAAVVMSAASPWALSEVGTSFTDVMASLPVLAAVALLVHTPVAEARRLALCGLLAGCGIGLKLTDGVFAPALAAACLLYGPRLTDRLRAAAYASAGIAAGFLIIDGNWSLALWRRFGNPVFPLFNGIFRSPDYAPVSFQDAVCLPHGVIDGLLRPFTWALAAKPVCDQSDIRFALILALLAASVPPHVRARVSSRSPVVAEVRGGGPARARLMTLFAVSLLCWLFMFSIPRYAVVQELLCGPVALAAALAGARGWRLPRWTPAAAGTGLAAAAAATLVAPSLGRVPFLPGQYGLRIPPELRDDGIFFVTGGAVTYVIPSLGKHARFFGITDWEDTNAAARTTITNRIVQGVQSAGSRKLRVIASLPLSLRTRIDLASFGVQLTSRCTSIPGFSFTNLTMICDLARGTQTTPAALTLEPDTPWRFSEPSSFPALLGATGLDWRFPGPMAALGAGHEPSLYFRLSPAFPPGRALSFAVSYRPSALRVSFAVNGTPATTIAQRNNPDGTTSWRGCVPAQAVAPDRMASVVLTAAPPPPPAPAPQQPNVQLLSFEANTSADCM